MSDCLAGNRRSRDKHNQNIMLIALIALIVLIALDVMGAGVSGIQAVAFFLAFLISCVCDRGVGARDPSAANKLLLRQSQTGDGTTASENMTSQILPL